jgi:ABC-2 type transport system ATP-binding protein
MPDAWIRLEQVSKRYATVTALDRVSLEIRRGEVFALLGPNGAGKSTLLRMLAGIIDPDEGSIHFDGSPALPPAETGYLPEERGLYRDIAILRTLVYFAEIRGMERRAAEQAAEEWLKRLSLWERRNEKLEALSKGNQQKVQFLTAILHRPRFVILDEPFSGLDPLNQELFLELLAELRRAGMTILLSAHHMQLVERVADRIALLNAGRLITCGTLEDLRASWTAGHRLRFRLAGSGYGGWLDGHEAVEEIEVGRDGQCTLLVRRGAPLSAVLSAMAGHAAVEEVHSEAISLHEIYVRAVRRDAAARSLAVEVEA